MSRGPLLTAALSVSAAVCLFVWRAAEALPGIWPCALFAPDPAEMAQLLLQVSDFPRLVAALLAGALLAGLILGLGLGGAASVMTLFHHEVLSAVFLWQAGSLVQDGWGASGILALTLGGVLLQGSTFRRPLRLLQAGKEAARSQSLEVGLWRAAIAALALGAAAMVAAQIGVLGFVGLLAPLLMRLTGASRPGLALVAGMGAGLLALSD